MLVAPSMLSADFGHLSEGIALIENSKADWYHLDIMDGVFVPNISYGFPVVKAIAKGATKPMDAHLMIVEPDKYISQFAELGVKYLSVHYEACPHLHRSIQNIKNNGMKAGVAINPHTPISALEEIVDYCDYVLIMSVNPGFGGQSFIETSVRKIATLKELIIKRKLNTLIEVDGGVTTKNCSILKEAGADVLVAGSAVFGAEDPYKAIELISCK